MKMSFINKIIVGFIIALCGLGAVSFLIFQNKQKLNESGRLMRLARDVISHSDEIVQANYNIQDATRDYINSGKPEDLKPIHGSTLKYREHIMNLKGLVKEFPQQYERVNKLEELLELRLKISDSLIHIRDEKGSKAALAHMSKGYGWRVMRQARNVLDEIQLEESKLLVAEEEVNRKAISKASNWFIFLLALIAAAVGLIFYIIIKYTKAKQKSAKVIYEKQELLQSVLNNNNSVVSIKKANGKYIMINNRFETLFHVKNDEIDTKSDYDIFSKELADKFRKVDEEVIQSGKVQQLEESIPHDDGLHNYLSIKFPLHDDKKNIYATGSISIDITERKQLEEEIRKAQNFLYSIIENIPNMILVKDAKELKFVQFNKAGEDLLGYKKEDLIGKSIYDVYPKEKADLIIAEDRKAITAGKLIEIPDEVIDTQTKGQRYLHTKKIPILNNEKQAEFLLAISEDITEQKRVQDEIKRSNTDLEQFAYIASHDLREPLRTISSFLQLFNKQHGENLNDEAKEYINFAVEGADRMQKLIDSLLQYSRITTQGKKPEPVDLDDVTENVLKNLAEAIKQNNAKVIVDTDLPPVSADENQMMQLMQNLIGNAMKFTKDKAPEIHINYENKNGEKIISVKDNGIGIPKEGIDRIFQIFQRLHTKEEYEGTGIGLAVCKKIVERHGGRIWVESEEGKGSTFYFTIK